MAQQRAVFEQQRRQDLINAKSRLARAAGGNSDGRAETFDARSGQIFIEQTISARPRRSLQRSNEVERRIHLQPRGPASLQDIARREFVRYLENLPADGSEELIEVLQSVPWQIAQRIWADAASMDLAQPLMVWSAFTSVYKNTKAITYHKTAINRPDPSDLPIYISRMTSSTHSWLVCLTITAPFTHTSIINLSSLTNLVVLDVGSSASTLTSTSTPAHSQITDTIIRSWSRSATETSAFSKLQALLLRDQPAITHLSLTYLNAFPSLVLYGVKACFRLCRSTHAMAESLGWTTSDDHGVLRAIEKDIESGYSWDCAMTSCFKHTTALLPTEPEIDADADAELEEGNDNRTADLGRPMLSFRLGMTPRDILSPNALDKMTFFRAKNAFFEPQDAKENIPSTSLESQKILLSRSTTRKLKRKKQFDLAEVLGESYDISNASSASSPPHATTTIITEPGTPTPQTASVPILASSATSAAQMRRSMPPPPSQPVRSTSNFDLMEMGSAVATAAGSGSSDARTEEEREMVDAKGVDEERKKTRSH